MLIGLIAFVVSLVVLVAVVAVGGAVGDQVSRDVELRVLVGRIESSEAAMSEVQAQEARALESYRNGVLSRDQLDDQLVEIAERGAENIAAAGDRVAAAEWLRWHRDIEAAQLAYLAHNRAWVEYLQRAAKDPTEFGRSQDRINETFAAAQEPLLAAVPSWDVLDVRPRIDAIFAEPVDPGSTQDA